MEKTDLHLHSNISDGTESPDKLLKTIIEAGITTFAITDHDNVDACEFLSVNTPEEIKFIPGVELTCKSEKLKSHVLGYNCDYKSEKLLKLIKKGKILRKQKLDTRIEFLKNVWNIELTQDELKWLNSRKSIVKTHLGMILVNRKLASNNVEAMDKYFDGCKTGNTRFSTQEAIEAIISAGGIPVWAHPLGGEGEQHIDEVEFENNLKIMLDFGIKGLECYYSRYSIKECELLVNYANKNNLLISAGSDYHGLNKTVKIAKLNTDDVYIPKKNINILNYL